MKNLKLISVLIIIFTSMSLRAATEKGTPSSTLPAPTKITTTEGFKPHVGLTLGIVNSEGNYDPGAEYGVDIGFQPYIPFGLALEVSHSTIENDRTASDYDRTLAMAKFLYNFGGTTPVIQHSYVGVGLGAAFENNGENFASAAILGFDIPLKMLEEKISLGALAKYTFYEGGSPDALSVNGMVKYWF